MAKIVAIDYDDTLSLNLPLWRELIEVFHSYGYEVYIITYRHSTQFSDMDLQIPHVKDYVFTGAIAKRKYCIDCGIHIDIWIDDSPETIVTTVTYGDYTEILTVVATLKYSRKLRYQVAVQVLTTHQYLKLVNKEYH